VRQSVTSNVEPSEDEIQELLNEARREDSRRREMSSGQVKQTPHGNILFKLKVDLPKAVPEEDFKKYMVEYGNIIVEAFSA
jgi:hypothetical protein